MTQTKPRPLSCSVHALKLSPTASTHAGDGMYAGHLADHADPSMCNDVMGLEAEVWEAAREVAVQSMQRNKTKTVSPSKTQTAQSLGASDRARGWGPSPGWWRGVGLHLTKTQEGLQAESQGSGCLRAHRGLPACSTGLACWSRWLTSPPPAPDSGAQAGAWGSCGGSLGSGLCPWPAFPELLTLYTPCYPATNE